MTNIKADASPGEKPMMSLLAPLTPKQSVEPHISGVNGGGLSTNNGVVAGKVILYNIGNDRRVKFGC